MHVDEESSDESENVCYPTHSEILLLSLTLQEEEFYTAGSLELLEARRQIAEFSLPRLDLLIG